MLCLSPVKGECVELKRCNESASLNDLLALSGAAGLPDNISLAGYRAFKYVSFLLEHDLAPLHRFFRCEAQLNFWALDPMGDLYVCFDACGNPELSVGRFLPELKVEEERLEIWRGHSSLNNKRMRRVRRRPELQRRLRLRRSVADRGFVRSIGGFLSHRPGLIAPGRSTSSPSVGLRPSVSSPPSAAKAPGEGRRWAVECRSRRAWFPRGSTAGSRFSSRPARKPTEAPACCPSSGRSNLHGVLIEIVFTTEELLRRIPSAPGGVIGLSAQEQTVQARRRDRSRGAPSVPGVVDRRGRAARRTLYRRDPEGGRRCRDHGGGRHELSVGPRCSPRKASPTGRTAVPLHRRSRRSRRGRNPILRLRRAARADLSPGGRRRRLFHRKERRIIPSDRRRIAGSCGCIRGIYSGPGHGRESTSTPQRGCPWSRCSFCSSPKVPGRRIRSDQVLDVIARAAARAREDHRLHR